MIKNKQQQQDQFVYMYGSRLLYEYKHIDAIANTSLFMTINVTNLNRPKQFKEKVYHFLAMTLNQVGIDINKKCINMIIAADIEGTRSGYTTLDVMMKPIVPHYHAIITFSDDAYKQLNAKFRQFKDFLIEKLATLQEINFSRKKENIDGTPTGFYLERFTQADKSKRYGFPLGNAISYVIKADIHANRNSISKYEPSVFPFDLNPSNEKVDLANKFYEKLTKKDATKFDQVKDYLAVGR